MLRGHIVRVIMNKVVIACLNKWDGIMSTFASVSIMRKENGQVYNVHETVWDNILELLDIECE